MWIFNLQEDFLHWSESHTVNSHHSEKYRNIMLSLFVAWFFKFLEHRDSLYHPMRIRAKEAKSGQPKTSFSRHTTRHIIQHAPVCGSSLQTPIDAGLWIASVLQTRGEDAGNKQFLWYISLRAKLAVLAANWIQNFWWVLMIMIPLTWH